jgi:hypothetical protein
MRSFEVWLGETLDEYGFEGWTPTDEKHILESFVHDWPDHVQELIADGMTDQEVILAATDPLEFGLRIKQRIWDYVEIALDDRRAGR